MPNLRRLVDTLSLFLPPSDGAPSVAPGAAAATDDAAFRDLPGPEWIPQAALVIGMARGRPIASQSLTEGRIAEIADLPHGERAAHLQVLIEEQRSLRAHSGFMGTGR